MIWKDWEAFASYAFNKSHAVCYAWLAYQTAYLKAHFPEEFAEAVCGGKAIEDMV
jgi:DNA polymerase-3 subunit alpha